MNQEMIDNLKRKLGWPKHSNWIAFGLLTIATLIILSPSLFFHSTFFTNLDNVDQFYSWYDKMATSIHNGEFPLWNSNTLGGQSFVGEIQQGVFYPVNLLFVWLFGSAEGIGQRPLEFLVALHFLIAAFGIYLVCKKMRLGTVASLAAGLTFAFSGVVAIRAASQTGIFFGLTLLPYSFLFLLKYYESKLQWKWLVASGISLGLIILSGHIQPFFHALLILVIYEVNKYFPLKKPHIKSLLAQLTQSAKRFAIIVITTFIVIAPQAWLTLQYFPNAYRVQVEGYQSPDVPLEYKHFAKSFNVDPHEAANLIDPNSYPARDGNNIYIGLLPLGIIILAGLFARKQIKRTKFWQLHSRFICILLVVSIFALIGYWTWFAVVLYELPLVRQVRQLGRYSIILHFALVALLAVSIDTLSRLKITKKQKFWFSTVAGFILINSVYIFLIRKHVFSPHFAAQNFLLACGIFSVALLAKEQVRLYALGFLVFLSALVNGFWFYPKVFPGVRTVSDYSLNRELVDLLDATDGAYRVETENNVLPVNIANAYDFQITGGYGATIYAPFFEFSHKSNLTADFRRDLLGVTYVITNERDAGAELVYEDKDSNMYVEKRSTALTKIFKTEKQNSTNREDYKPLEVTTNKYQDHYQNYTVTTEGDSEVIISEMQYPNWELKVDGKRAQWQPYYIDGIPVFRSFWLAKGTHTVEFEYKPFGI